MKMTMVPARPASVRTRQTGTMSRLPLAAAALGLLFVGACNNKVILEGERFPVRADLSDSLQLPGQPPPRGPVQGPVAGSQPIVLPATQVNADWAQRGGNARHAAPHAAFRTAPQLVWAADIGQGASRMNRIAAAPVVAGGRIFAMDAGMLVSAVSTAGAPLWQADLTPGFDPRGNLSGGGLAAEGNRLYVTTAYGEVIALDAASGNVVWRRRVDAPVHGAPAVADGVIYASTRNGSAWALDARDGKMIWNVVGTPELLAAIGTSAPTIGDRAVFFPNSAGDIMAVLKAGGGIRIWRESIAGERPGRVYARMGDITGDPALIGNTLYAGTAAGRTAALDAGSGQKIWTAEEGALGPLAIAGGSVFLINDEARLVRLDESTGKVIWEVALPYFVEEKPKKHRAIYAHYGPILAGGRLWVASSDGNLRGFSPIDGRLVASHEIPGGAAAQPAVAGGTMYVVTNRGQLLAYR